MKVQVRKNAITFLYEVQTCEENKSVWSTIATFKTREEAEKYADKLKGGKVSAKVKAPKEKKPKAPKEKK